MLHLIFQSSIEPVVLQRMATGDCAVFLGNAVLGLLKNGRAAAILGDLTGERLLYALSEDLSMRGICESELTLGIKLIDYQQLVDLTVTNSPIQTWN